MNQSESFNQLTLPTLEYENKKMSLFGDVCETQFHYADFTEIGNYRTENTLNGEIEIYLDVQPLFDPNYNPLYVSNWKSTQSPTQYVKDQPTHRKFDADRKFASNQGLLNALIKDHFDLTLRSRETIRESYWSINPIDWPIKSQIEMIWFLHISYVP